MFAITECHSMDGSPARTQAGRQSRSAFLYRLPSPRLTESVELVNAEVITKLSRLRRYLVGSENFCCPTRGNSKQQLNDAVKGLLRGDAACPFSTSQRSDSCPLLR